MLIDKYINISGLNKENGYLNIFKNRMLDYIKDVLMAAVVHRSVLFSHKPF